MSSKLISVLSIIVFAPIAAVATDYVNCHIEVRNSVKDDMGNLWQKGQVLPADIARDAPEGRFYCAHGGSCIPGQLNGRDTSHLLDCHVGPSIGDGDFQLRSGKRESE